MEGRRIRERIENGRKKKKKRERERENRKWKEEEEGNQDDISSRKANEGNWIRITKSKDLCRIRKGVAEERVEVDG